MKRLDRERVLMATLGLTEQTCGTCGHVTTTDQRACCGASYHGGACYNDHARAAHVARWTAWTASLR